MFILVLFVTISITVWASRRSRSRLEFYSAGGRITAWQNGLAIAGDALSAGAFLGLTALVYSRGFDGLIYAVGYTVGFPCLVFIIAERLRLLGRYTFADVLCHQLGKQSIRVFAGSASVIIVMFYLIAQMVGAGQLIGLMFGIDYDLAEIIIGVLMILYVAIGGMLATTLVQITKAVLLLTIGTWMAVAILARYNFSYNDLLTSAISAKPSLNLLRSVTITQNPASALSLSLALLFGTAGLPHVLMRFFTVPDVRTARRSVMWATGLIGYFYALIFVLGIGAVAIVTGNPLFVDKAGVLIGGSNMAAIHLADALGGNVMLGVVSAVAFATIIAVVAGLTLAGASAISHDLYSLVVKTRSIDGTKEVFVSKISACVIGVFAIALGIVFQKQNVAYMISLAFGIAASSTFPVLLLALFWKNLTNRGAIAGGVCGLLSSVILTVMGPSIWVKTLGFSTALFSIEPPTIITLPAAIIVCFIVSFCDGKSSRYSVDSSLEAAVMTIGGSE